MKRAKDRRRLARARIQRTMHDLMTAMAGAYAEHFYEAPREQYKAMAKAMTDELTKIVANTISKKLARRGFFDDLISMEL